MPNYLLAIHGTPKINSPEEGQQMMQDWQAWNDTLQIEDEGHPVGQSYTVHKDGVEDHGGANPISGYTIIKADSIEAACDAARGCPLVTKGWGSVEVAECMDMTMDG